MRKNKTELIHIRIEPEVKEQAEEIFKKLGINTSYAVSIFLKQVILKQGVPFEVELPKEETAIQEQTNLAKLIQKMTESSKVSEKNKQILQLFADGQIDLETAIFALRNSILKNI